MLSAKYGGNTFYVGLQKVGGDDAWMRVNGTSGGTLANDSYNSSYDNAKEKNPGKCATTSTSPLSACRA
nr:hypothetical protein GCM10020185_67980 [Pseudomonas brassicacearum subsp. brassicacearum]